MFIKNINVRVFIDENLYEDKYLDLNLNQYNYIKNVLRLKIGDYIKVINGKSGEFLGEIAFLQKNKTKIKIINKVKEIEIPPDLWLIFCPLKKTNTDYVIKKATELGIRKIIPVLTSRTNNKNFRKEKMVLNMIEALEQCGGTFLPYFDKLINLENLLENWNNKRQLIFCNEKRVDESIGMILKKHGKKVGAILVGPEGGFCEKEIIKIKSIKSSISVSLGPRVLRAETAAISAISIWQSMLGDWN
tara:strand:- start:1334 stop:2071 length:738 start_codon:yes stop_codon:yes gene_type:complete